VARVSRLAITLVVAALAAQVGVAARADTAPIADSPDLPWTNPTHESSLEVLASKIASAIAKRPVTIRCEGDTDWVALVLQGGGNPDSELGYVGVSFRNGQVNITTFAELAGGKVCLPLKRYAVATTKPTKCRSLVQRVRKVTVTKRVAVKKTVVVAGKRRVKTTWVTRKVPTRVVRTVPGQPTACYQPVVQIEDVPNSFWDAYSEYGYAMLTLAHEAIHLGGVVGGRTANGTILGDPLAEAKAQCWGMQWIPYVAQELGATPDDAEAIAQFVWDWIYPQYQSGRFSHYWSADCRPGGALDLKLPGGVPWPDG
jgi:hypothetical protein